MGADSSWAFLKASLMWKEGSIVSDAWVDQTSTFLDSSTLLAALLYGIFGNLFVAYGIANIIVLILILVSMSSLLQKIGVNSLSRFFAINLVICPYLTEGFFLHINDLGYFSNTLGGPQFYGLRVLIVLLIIREYIVTSKTRKMDIVGYITFPLCVLAGLSSGFYIIAMIILPYMLYEVFKTFRDNNIRILFKFEAIYSYICLVCVLLGKVFASRVLHINISDNKTWIPLISFFDSIAAPFLGFLKLLGVLPLDSYEISVATMEGIYRLFPMLIFIVIVIAVITLCVKKIKKKEKNNQEIVRYLLTIVVVNYVLLAFFNVRYISVIFEERYLITTFFVLVLLVAIYINELDENRLFSWAVMVGLFVAILCNNCVSDRKYLAINNDSWQMEKIKQIVDENDTKLIYIWDETPVADCTGRAMRAYDLDNIYKCVKVDGTYNHWGDYVYFDNNTDYDGSTLFIVPKENCSIPDSVLNGYEFLEDLDNVCIYKSDNNSFNAT